MKISVIGAGNLGSALLDGLINAGFCSHDIWATARSQSRLDLLHKRLGIQVSCDNIEATKSAEVLILAVKPAIISIIATELAALIIAQKPLVISVAAGPCEQVLRQYFSEQCPIVRAMPNTAAAVRCSATALYANAFVSSAQRQITEKIFDAIGQSIWVENEEQFNIITAISGSGPAYFFLMIDALQSVAKQLGLPDTIARQLILQTALGSARMACETNQSAQSLGKQVAPEGGGTEKALKVLENGRFKELMFNAVDAALKYYQGLAKL